MKYLYITILVIFFYTLLRVEYRLQYNKTSKKNEELNQFYKTLNAYKQDLTDEISKEKVRLIKQSANRGYGLEPCNIVAIQKK